jgi:hypothetical protein
MLHQSGHDRRIHKVIITGTGRAGTTFLVQLLTKLGLDTGYTPKNMERGYFAHCSAGLEHDPEDSKAPYIVKNPELCEGLPAILGRGTISIDHAIIPVRSLEDAASSRIRIGGEGQVPGGLWGTGQTGQQKAVLAEKFHALVHTLTVHEIPHVFLHFPRFAQDPDYTYRKLGWLVGNIPREDFLAAFTATARPELIHDFASGPPAGTGTAARVFTAQEARKRRQRRTKRIMGAGVLSAIVWLGVGWMLPNETNSDSASDAVTPATLGAAYPWWHLQHSLWPNRRPGLTGNQQRHPRFGQEEPPR